MRAGEEFAEREVNRIPDTTIRPPRWSAAARRIRIVQSWREQTDECRGGAAGPELFTSEYRAAAGDPGVAARQAGHPGVLPVRVQSRLYRRAVPVSRCAY